MSRAGRESYGLVHFLLWPFLFTGLLAFAEELARRAGVVVPDSVSGAILYAGMAAWMLYRAARPPYAIRLGALSEPPTRRSDWKLLWIVVPLVAVAGGAFHVVVLAASFVAPRVAESLAAPDPSDTLPLRLLPGDLIESAIGAIAEEWLFRGVLLHLWARRFGVRFAVLSTSMVFAALHADVVGSLIFGIVMAALYVRTGTLLVPIAVHLAFNAVVSLLVVVVGDMGLTTVAAYREHWREGVAAFVVGVAVISVAVRRIAPWPWQLTEGRTG